MYGLLRPLLFTLDAEKAHHLTLDSLRLLRGLGLPRVSAFPEGCAREVMGVPFPTPVGLAAGLDKNGDYIDALAALGFGFLEIGTVTPRPQPGNPRPRLFRVEPALALINRMGFNNAGVERLVENVRRAAYRGVLGINIGKNFDTPLERAADDYVHCLRAVYPHATYVTINVSSPNTAGLRTLQDSAALEHLLATIGAERPRLADRHGKRVPVALKIAPDLDEPQIDAIAALVQRHAIDAVIATNTTTARNGVAELLHGGEAGGLSGAPLTARAENVTRSLARALGGTCPIVGVGGIMSGAHARERCAAGAALVQLYTGLIYRGPALVRECTAALCSA
ncbi:MAG TPA: quinone-dependent dihydroorotate dehydrogenase [Burkholderiales bacterium]|nr:quinone-dependent dihydroorotate dehydrogenase [Burkholderiales bacterium]